jgi:HTH-type transcriptional regulator / antitoxin MqsA
MNTKCQICGSTDTEIVSKTEIFKYKGRKIEIPDYKQVHCRNCGESVADPKAVKRSEPILRDAQRTIEGLLTGNEIKAIRKSFNMTQEEFSEILGGGEKAFARYETGRVAQSRPMDNLLKILKAIPVAMDVLKPTPTESSCFAEAKLQYNPYVNDKPFGYIIHAGTFRKLVA